MKKFFILFLILFLPCVFVYGQITEGDALIAGLLVNSGAAQVIYYGQQIADNITQITNTFTQIEHMKEAAQRSIQNLASIKDIGSRDDFMDFYNRQLYLERQTGQIWDNTTVTIGKKQYHISQLQDMEGNKKRFVYIIFFGFRADFFSVHFTEKDTVIGQLLYRMPLKVSLGYLLHN